MNVFISVAWFVVGLLAGWTADIVAPTEMFRHRQFDLWLGFNGAGVFGVLYGLLMKNPNDAESVLVALIGAVVILALWRLIAKPSRHLNY